MSHLGPFTSPVLDDDEREWRRDIKRREARQQRENFRYALEFLAFIVGGLLATWQLSRPAASFVVLLGAIALMVPAVVHVVGEDL